MSEWLLFNANSAIFQLYQGETRKNCFRYLKLMSPLNAANCTTISYTLWDEWYYLKNNYLTLRSKVKVPRRSLWYETHRLMVMHPHTKYNWPIWKEKRVMVLTSFAAKKQKKRKKRKKKSDKNNMSPFVQRRDITS